MTSRKMLLILALLFPILVLMVWTVNTHIDRDSGPRYVLKIYGFDPFDVLRGHYLRYRVQYDIPGVCRPREPGEKRLSVPIRNTAYICLEPRSFSYAQPGKGCKAYMRGRCKNTLFVAGIEKYYIPEEHAKTLERNITENTAKIEISVNSQGQAYVTDLLIDDISWKEFLK